MAVLEAVEASAQECLAVTGGSHNKGRFKQHQVVPGWFEYVKPYAEECKFWFAIWSSAGKPDSGSLHDVMVLTKRQYKYAIR